MASEKKCQGEQVGRRVKCAATKEISIAVLQNIQHKLLWHSGSISIPYILWVYIHKNGHVLGNLILHPYSYQHYSQ